LALLAYAGVDLVDTDKVVVAGTQGKYLLPDGSYRLADIDVLPCPCPVCEQPVENVDREDCVDHNVNILQSEIRRIQHRIRTGQLREYVEGVVRHEPWLTAALQEFDQQWGYLETRTPVFRNAEIKSTTTDTLRRVEIQRFADRVTSRYINRFDDVPLVLVPCSAKKPYSESQSHGQFHDAIQYRGHIVSMSSPIGVVPRELELTYPAQHYDSAVTGDWSQTEIEFVASVLERYLDRNQYPRVIAHVPPNGYDDICEKVANRINVSFDYTVTDHPTTDESLATLAETLEDERQISLQERNRKTLKAIADYQFGDQAGDAMFDSLTLQGRYPKLQGLNASGEQLISLVPQYGLLALTLKGAQRWDDSSVTTKRVTIEDFVPHGSVLAPGIISASDAIRVGEEVVIEGPSAFGVGRATMPGPAMESASRGVAVDVRHVREQ
ncbi:MAG: archaeosine synthase subunit alpha, partial [Halobacteriaceae archaeon]